MGNSSSSGRSKLGQGSKVAPSSSAQQSQQTTFFSITQKVCAYLKLNPRDKKSGDEEEYISLQVELASSSVKHNTVVDASFKLLIYDQLHGNHSKHLVSHNFQTASKSSGVSCMTSLRKLKKQSSGFLVNNNCVFGVEFIKVTTSKANATSETLFVQKTSIFNEAKTYTWDIEDFFALKNPDCSPEYISMYPSREGNHLSLYLNLKKTNDLPNDTANLVELTLSIKNKEAGNRRKGTGRCQFSRKARCWGWSKFISLGDFKGS
ncbi:hypothetical protein BDA96_01G232300 [Sorghum bicolor]|nr:hypothetical protein BDA96_01G232300 [Sorghum bicolor]